MKRLNQAQKAYSFIRDQLVARVLQPGQRLTEKSWAERLNVNRFDIREAFSRLLGEGLLESGPKGGYFVREFTAEDMTELNYVRHAFESAAARLAVVKASDDDLEELRKIVELMEAMAQNAYALGVFEADLHFHEVLVRASHNKKLQEIYAHANLPLSARMNMPAPTTKEQLLKTADFHRATLDALMKKQAETVIGLLRTGLTGINGSQGNQEG